MQRRDRIFGKLAGAALALAPAIILAQAAWAQTFTTLYSFSNTGTGGRPSAGLVQATNGDLYGTAGGTAFKITPGGTLTTLYSFCSQSGCTDDDLLKRLRRLADPGHQRGLLRDGVPGRDLWLWDGLQDDPKRRHADDAVQLQWLLGRRLPLC